MRRFRCFVCLFLVLFFLLQYLLTPDYGAYSENGEPILNGATFYAKTMEHEMYHSKHNIDMMIIGSSHVYWQYIPSALDKSLNLYTFNAGSSAQRLDASYALLVEAGKTNKIQTVLLELCPTKKGEVYSERTELSSTYIIADFMHFGINKIKYLLNASSSKYYINSFFPLLRNKEKYFEKGFVKNVIKRKLSWEYISGVIPDYSSDTGVRYVERGYIEHSSKIENEDWKSSEMVSPINNPMFSSDEKESIDSIVKYCKKNNIRLVLISTPLTDFNIRQYGNYDSGREQIAQYAKKHSVEFYDFNLCKPEYFTYESTKFFDPSHMNKTGAKEYSDLLGRFFSDQIRKDELFYDSHHEKMDAMGNRVFGLKYKVEEKGNEKIVRLYPVASAEFPVYVNVKRTSTDGKEMNIMQNHLLEDLHFKKEEKGTLTIEVLGDNPKGDITNIIHIAY